MDKQQFIDGYQWESCELEGQEYEVEVGRGREITVSGTRDIVNIRRVLDSETGEEVDDSEFTKIKNMYERPNT